MISDPPGAQSRSLVVGLVLALVVTAGCGVLSLLRPTGTVGDAKIVLAEQSGALFVQRDGVLHPVPNLASGRLIAGEPADPVRVKDSRLRSYPRGPAVGIAGAPQQLPGPARAYHADEPPLRWLLCDRFRRAPADEPAARDQLDTLVAVGGDGTTRQRPDTGALVTTGGATWVLHAGGRSAVDPADPTVAAILDLPAAAPRPVSAALLNAFAEADPIAVPAVPHRGEPSAAVPGHAVGSVIEVARVQGDRLLVVLANGVQELTAVAAELVRAADPHPEPIAEVSVAAAAAAPTIAVLPVRDVPATAPRWLDTRTDPVLCAALTADGAGGGDTVLTSARRWPSATIPVPLAGRDGAGPRLDAVAVAPGTGELVIAAQPGGERTDGLFYVTDAGVRHAIDDLETARILGLTGDPRPTPWAVLAPLPQGPALQVRAATATRDG